MVRPGLPDVGRDALRPRAGRPHSSPCRRSPVLAALSVLLVVVGHLARVSMRSLTGGRVSYWREGLLLEGGSLTGGRASCPRTEGVPPSHTPSTHSRFAIPLRALTFPPNRMVSRPGLPDGGRDALTPVHGVAHQSWQRERAPYHWGSAAAQAVGGKVSESEAPPGLMSMT
jgi:hypothetical protein